MNGMKNKSLLARTGRVAVLAAAAVAVVALSACGKKEGGATQVAAKVNGDEITVHQINFVLQQQRGLRADQSEMAQHRILDRLIDEQIAVQNAEKLKLDRDPDTVQRIEEAKREILARAYIESVANGAAKPADTDVRKYFDQHPGLFANRKIYTLQRLEVPAPADKQAEVVAHAESARNQAEFTDWLKSQDLKFNVNPMTQPAEALPLAIVDKLATLNDGQSLAMPQQLGVSVFNIVSTQPAPKTFDDARGAIEQFLGVEAKRAAVQTATKNLRDGAKIEYVGKFAASDAAPVNALAPASGAASAAVTSSSAATSGIDAASLQKGLGLK